MKSLDLISGIPSAFGQRMRPPLLIHAVSPDSYPGYHGCSKSVNVSSAEHLSTHHGSSPSQDNSHHYNGKLIFTPKFQLNLFNTSTDFNTSEPQAAHGTSSQENSCQGPKLDWPIIQSGCWKWCNNAPYPQRFLSSCCPSLSESFWPTRHT